MGEPEARAQQYEAQHVHSVYEEIASHFSSTRYKVGIIFCAWPKKLRTITNVRKPWPIVEQFLKSLPDGAVGADVGCGNGKYLAVNKKVFIVGSDRYVRLKSKSNWILFSGRTAIVITHSDQQIWFKSPKVTALTPLS